MFKVYQYQSHLCLQDCRTADGQKLHVGVETRDLTQVTLEEIQDIPSVGAMKTMNVHLVYGIYSLLSGPHLAVVTESKLVGYGPAGEKIWTAVQLEILPVCSTSSGALTSREQRDEKKYISMLRSVINDHPNAFFFSLDYPLTISAQRLQQRLTVERAKTPTSVHRSSSSVLAFWQKSDEQFFWNRRLMEDFVSKRLHQWICPVINGFVEIANKCEINGITFDFIFITRRSWQRIGTRFCTRGADKYGNVANFAETEMIMAQADGSLASYVQIRGSIPLYWDQLATLKYMPRTRYSHTSADSVLDWNEKAFSRHMENIITKYGKVTLVNLIDKVGKSSTVRDQIQLGTAFAKYTKRYGAADKLEYVWFDFHHECRKLQWHNLSKLMAQVDEQFQAQGCYKTDSTGTPTSFQNGVFRVNCMDNLDRTNVVQSLFARRSLLLALDAYDPQYSNVLDSPFSNFERVFKNVWADNADAVSVMYAGTGALKTDFTRTGKRTVVGAIQDGINSVRRYYLNNFRDGCRQDCYDLFVGNYEPTVRNRSPFTFQQQHSFLVFVLKLAICAALIVMTLLHIVITSDSDKPGEDTRRLQRSLQITVGLFLLLAYFILKKGSFRSICRHFVCKPVLCPSGYPSY